MRAYTAEQPFVFIHVPKCAGTSLKKVFKQWYRGSLKLHYFNEREKQMPERHLLEGGDCVFGHFTRVRGYGVYEYYPEPQQIMSMFRDPFEVAQSRYWHTVKMIKSGKLFHNGTRIETFAEPNDWVAKASSNLDIHMPCPVNLTNYKDILDNHFIYIGIAEDMDWSLKIMAYILNKPVCEIPFLNTSPREDSLSITKEEHRNCDALNYAMYDHALSNHNAWKEKLQNDRPPFLPRAPFP